MRITTTAELATLVAGISTLDVDSADGYFRGAELHAVFAGGRFEAVVKGVVRSFSLRNCKVFTA